MNQSHTFSPNNCIARLYVCRVPCAVCLAVYVFVAVYTDLVFNKRYTFAYGGAPFTWFDHENEICTTLQLVCNVHSFDPFDHKSLCAENVFKFYIKFLFMMPSSSSSSPCSCYRPFLVLGIKNDRFSFLLWGALGTCGWVCVLVKAKQVRIAEFQIPNGIEAIKIPWIRKYYSH